MFVCIIGHGAIDCKLHACMHAILKLIMGTCSTSMYSMCERLETECCKRHVSLCWVCSQLMLIDVVVCWLKLEGIKGLKYSYASLVICHVIKSVLIDVCTRDVKLASSSGACASVLVYTVFYWEMNVESSSRRVGVILYRQLKDIFTQKFEEKVN